MPGSNGDAWPRQLSYLTAVLCVPAPQDRVNWKPGQLITITTSYWRDEMNNQNEVAVVASVSADGKTIGLQQPLAAPHYGGYGPWFQVSRFRVWVLPFGVRHMM